MDDYLVLGATLAVESLFTIFFTSEYFRLRKLLNALTAALDRGINNVTVKDLKSSGEPQLSVVRGRVRAIGPAIKSLNQPSVCGVIQRLTVKEHASLKNGVSLWTDHQNVISSKLTVIPFEICDGKYSIVVTSPLDAKYLNLTVIDDRFEPSVSSVFNLLFGIHQKGFQYTELLLKEHSIVTGFGELTLDKNEAVRLIPPRKSLDYILTTMDTETLIHHLKYDKRFYKICCIIFSAIGLCIVGIMTFKLWRERKHRISVQKLKTEALRQRGARNVNVSEDLLLCIVCLTLPREVVFLPCGHVSVCFNCAEQIRNLCPVCRQNIENINLVYLS